jgi:hypothetical protein
MSDTGDVASTGRRVVFDVHNNYPRSYVGDQPNGFRSKKRRNRKYGGPRQQPAQLQQPCSIELQRAINAVTEYGRQAHALGAIRALNLLMNVAARLKAMAGEPRPDELLDLANEAETAVAEIRGTMSRAYERT